MTESLYNIIDENDMNKINHAIVTYGTMSIGIADILEDYKKKGTIIGYTQSWNRLIIKVSDNNNIEIWYNMQLNTISAYY